MLNLNKPKFWDKKKISILAIILFPLSLITILVICLKKLFSEIRVFKIPIICIGNVYIGGTGKTPAAILIAKELFNFGIKTSILRKYYRNHYDEYNQIKFHFRHLIVNKDRVKGIQEAEVKNYDAVILDDGLQDYRIRKNFSIICFNQKQLIGNGLILPSGPLRENLSAIKNADMILINGNRDLNFEKKILKIKKNLDIYYSYYKPINIHEFKNKKLLAFAGIANPENFFQLLEKNNLIIKEKLIFPDHHIFTKKEIQNIIEFADINNLKIIMTEKDFFKVNKFKFKQLNYLRISLQIDRKKEFFNKLKKAI